MIGATEARTGPLPATTTAPTPSRRWHLPRGDGALAALIALGFQTVLTLFGVLAERVFSPLQRHGSGSEDLPEPSLLQHTQRWDSGYFLEIPDGLYGSDPQSPAFYPLFPLLARAVELASFGLLTDLGAGLLLNTVATWVIVLALLKIVALYDVPRPGALLAVGAMLTAPSAFFLHMFYSEATFMALGFAAYLFALRRQWMWMGLCLVPLTASRITAVLFVGLCFLEFCRSRGWSLRALLTPAVLWFPIGLLGFACYACYLHFETGGAFDMFEAYSAGPYWEYHDLDPNIVRTLAEEIGFAADAIFGDGKFDNVVLVNQVLPLAGLLLALVASGYLVVVLGSRGVPLAVFGVASLLMFTLNDNLISVHRYLLPVLVIYVAGAVLVTRRPAARPVVYGVMHANALLQAALMVLFVSNFWAG